MLANEFMDGLSALVVCNFSNAASIDNANISPLTFANALHTILLQLMSNGSRLCKV